MPGVEAKRRFCCTSGISLAEQPLHDGKADGAPLISIGFIVFPTFFVTCTRLGVWPGIERHSVSGSRIPAHPFGSLPSRFLSPFVLFVSPCSNPPFTTSLGGVAGGTDHRHIIGCPSIARRKSFGRPTIGLRQIAHQRPVPATRRVRRLPASAPICRIAFEFCPIGRCEAAVLEGVLRGSPGAPFYPRKRQGKHAVIALLQPTSESPLFVLLLRDLPKEGNPHFSPDFQGIGKRRTCNEEAQFLEQIHPPKQTDQRRF